MKTMARFATMRKVRDDEEGKGGGWCSGENERDGRKGKRWSLDYNDLTVVLNG